MLFMCCKMIQSNLNAGKDASDHRWRSVLDVNLQTSWQDRNCRPGNATCSYARVDEHFPPLVGRSLDLSSHGTAFQRSRFTFVPRVGNQVFVGEYILGQAKTLRQAKRRKALPTVSVLSGQFLGLLLACLATLRTSKMLFTGIEKFGAFRSRRKKPSHARNLCGEPVSMKPLPLKGDTVGLMACRGSYIPSILACFRNEAYWDFCNLTLCSRSVDAHISRLSELPCHCG